MKWVNLKHKEKAKLGFYFQAQKFPFWYVGREEKGEKALIKPVVFNKRG